MNNVQMIPVDLIDPHPHNPRRDLGDLTELADSIKAQGIQQNLLLVPKRCCEAASLQGFGYACREHGSKSFGYTAVIGHRRLAAARLAGLTDVPAVVNPRLSESEQISFMIIENVQRENLSPMEEAEGYQQLLDLGMKVRTIAKVTGRNEKTVTGRIRLMGLPEDARQKVHLGQATLEDAAELEKLAKHPDLYARVAGFLGSSNFTWQLREAKDQVNREAKWAPLLARLAELGIAPITPEEKSAGTATLGGAASVADLNALTMPDDLTAVRYRTVEWDDRVFLHKLTPKDPDADAERAARQREAKDEQERALAEDRAFFDHRDEWVRSYITRKRVPAKDQLAIMAAVAPLVLSCELGLGRWQLGQFLRPDGQRNEDTPQVLEQALADQFPGIDPASILLLAMHLGAGTLWSDAYRWPKYAALYALLEQLGYPVSDAERARITPPIQDEAES